MDDNSVIIDVHCHIGFSARRVDPNVPCFSFERDGAVGTPGYDSYLSQRLLRRPGLFFIRRWLGLGPKHTTDEDVDRHIEAISEHHRSTAESVGRLVLLAFDEYRDDTGRAIGAAERGQRFGSDQYTSNSLVRAVCAARPDRYLFGASIHPYRTQDGRDACAMLAEVAEAGAALVKWLPIHQNIRADDPRTIAFLRKAAELGVPMLIHYGGEMTLSRQHMEFESPIPLLDVLRVLRADGHMPTVMIAHAATPSFIWQSAAGHQALVDALLGEFADAPLYGEISALGAFGRTPWLRRLARRKELHHKLIWGSDFPIPVMTWAFLRHLDRRTRRQIDALPSWIERSYRLARAIGFDDAVFHRAARLLAPRISGAVIA